MPIVFMDTETTGLDPSDHIWEWAAIRREDDGTESTYHAFVDHELALAENLPESFRADHHARYDPAAALTVREFVGVLRQALAGRPHIVGAVPNFDTERLAVLLRHHGYEPMWHYHLWDIETMAIGYLLASDPIYDGRIPDTWNDSNALSRRVGVEPPTTERHTALGDVRWIRAIFDKITGRPDTRKRAGRG